MGKLTDKRDQVVNAIKALSAFSGLEEHVHAFRPLEPEKMQMQTQSKAYGLAVFVSVERVKSSGPDKGYAKQPTIITDLWINTNNAIDVDDDALDLLEAIIGAVSGLAHDSDLSCDAVSSFEDAFRVLDAPKPYLVYRVITNTHTIIN